MISLYLRMERSQSKNNKKNKKIRKLHQKISDVVSQEITLKCQFFFYLYVRCSLSFRKALRIVSFGSSFEFFGLIATTKFDFLWVFFSLYNLCSLVDKISGHTDKVLHWFINLIKRKIFTSANWNHNPHNSSADFYELIGIDLTGFLATWIQDFTSCFRVSFGLFQYILFLNFPWGIPPSTICMS